MIICYDLQFFLCCEQFNSIEGSIKLNQFNPIMFSGYEGLMPYYVDHQDVTVMSDNDTEEFVIPAHYMPHEPSTDPWFRTSASPSDFLLLAEGSELEGPMPLIIIPKNGSGKFNVDEFVVRIMSVDHQLMSSCSFSISEDVQVFLSQMENGIYAYVHYFTLYDSLARGFVRPFCLAYVTPDYSKITHMSHELMVEFARVSECFKSGNYLVFFQDMAHILSDLQFTRERYIECQRDYALELENHIPEISYNQVGMSEEKALQLIHLHELDSSIAEVKNILQTLNEKLEKTDRNADHRFCDNRVVEPRETPLDSDNFRITNLLNSSQMSEKVNHLSINCSEAACQMIIDMSESYKPKLKTNLKPTIQRSLRSINDLCQKRAKQGLDYLHNAYKYFRRNTATLLLEKEDSSILDPSCSLLTIGRTVYLNFLKGFDVSGNGGCPITSPRACSLVCSPTGALAHKWQSSDSLASFYSCETPESFVSCSVPSPSCQNPLPAVSPITLSQMGQLLCDQTEPVDEMKKSQDHISADVSQFQTSIQAPSRPQTLSLDQKSRQIPTQVSVISVSDHVYNLKQTSYGIGAGILQFVKQYSFAGHLIYSLLCGRPVVILGSMSFEKEIRELVTALWIFLPGHSSDSHFVLPWTTVPLKLNDLMNLKLCGLGKPEKKSYEWMIPKNLKSYATLFYFDRKSLWGPKYEGGILNEIIQMSQAFECDGSYISFVHSKLFQLMLKSFSYFHGFCMRKSPGFSDGLEHVSQQESWMEMSRAFANKLDLTENDRRIVEYLAEVVIMQQSKEIEECQLTERPSTIRLDHQISHLFYS